MRLELWIPGRPVPQGSKTVMRNRSTGRSVLIEACKDLKPWRERVRAIAQEHYTDAPMRTAVCVHVEFLFARPKSHWRTGRHADKLKNDAPLYPATKSRDVDKLLRAVLDGLTGVVFDDDGRVVDVSGLKMYSLEREGAQITITTPLLR